MGSIVKGVASLFGGRKRRREQCAANKEFDQAKAGVTDFAFEDPFKDLEANTLGDASVYDASVAESATLGPAAQAQMGTLGAMQGYDAAQGSAQGYSSQGYEGQGYDSQGYTAQGTNVAGLARGADTGLTNTMNNLQVSTAAAEMAAQEADQSLAASQDLAAQAGTGAGGATALAAAAAKSKAGISADIQKQEAANNIRRAQAESQLQQNQLAQGNLASQFDLGQDQFNAQAQNRASEFTAGAANQAAQFGANAQNQANQFTAGAANQAAQFGAQSTNQMAMANMQAQNQALQFGAAAGNQGNLAQFGAQNQMNQFNTGAQNQFAQNQFTADNQFALANQNAINDAAQFGAGAQNQFAMQNQQQLNAFQLAQATGAADIQESQYAQATDVFGIASGRKMAADNARKQATSDALGGLTSVVNIGAKAAMMSDRRLKKDIKLIGYSSSGLKIYNFKYKSKPDNIYQGVMSDEIPSHAVIKHSSGFDWVDYSLLDVEFKLID
jgi:hypothetical protein